MKEYPKKIQLKKQSQITLTQSRVLKNIKNYQPKAEMQERKNPPNMRERERERENLFCEGKLCIEWNQWMR